MYKLFKKGDKVLFVGDKATFDSYHREKTSYVIFEEDAGRSIVSTKSLKFDAASLTFEELNYFMKEHGIEGSTVSDIAWAKMDNFTKQLFINDMMDLFNN